MSRLLGETPDPPFGAIAGSVNLRTRATVLLFLTKARIS